ncbi:MAG TPA: alpha/beta hydrolase [Capillimicrobium sp.]|nr:alpha/beta hydrolase [Capillimicrobium sp.]
MAPTVLLVHGAFAENSSWDGVVDSLQEQGLDVVAASNPLRGLAGDAAAISDLVASISGPVILVGHSYGGMVATNVRADAGKIAGVVYVAAFAPDAGESAFSLAGLFPGSTLGDALRPVPRSDGTTDLYIDPQTFHDQFAADLPREQAQRMAVTQRPVTQEALLEPSGDLPLWREVPSWFLFGELDRNIPAALEHHMAERCRARRTIEVPGGSHAVGVSHARAVAHLVTEAAAVHAV